MDINSSFGMTLPAPKRSRIDMIVPAPIATASLYDPVFCSISSATSPVDMAMLVKIVVPPSNAAAGTLNGAVKAAAKPPPIATPLVAIFSPVFSAIQPTASERPPCW